MPTVPTQPLPSVTPQPVRLVFQSAEGATADVFGAGTARGLQRAGGQLGQAGDQLATLALQQAAEDNEREAKLAMVEFDRAKSDLLVGSATTPGYIAQQGENAVRGYPEFQQSVESLRRERLNQIRSPRVREMFDAASQVSVAGTIEQASRHLAREREAARVAVAEARLQGYADDAAAAWNDPQALARSVALTTAEVAQLYEGRAPELRANKLSEARTNIYRSAIVAALRSDPVAAQALYDRNRPLIAGTARAEIEQMLETATVTARSQQIAQALWAKHGASGIEAARAEAMSTTSGKLLDETLRRLEHEEARVWAAEARQYAREEREYRAESRALAGLAFTARDAIVGEAVSERDALAAVDRIDNPRLRAEVGPLVRDYYEVRRRLTSEERAGEAFRLLDEFNAVYETEREVRFAIETIEDPQMRAAVTTLANDYFSTDRRLTDEEMLGHVQDLAQTFAAEEDTLDAEIARARREVSDPKVQQQVVEELGRMKTQADNARRQQSEEAFSAAYRFLYDESNPDRSLAAFQRQNPELFALMTSDGPAMSALQRAEDQVRLGQTYARVSDPDTLARVRSMPVNQLAALEPSAVRSRLSQNDYEQLLGWIRAAQDKVQSVSQNQEIYGTAETVLKRMAPKGLNWGSEKASQEKRDIAEALRNEMRVFISAAKQQGRLPTQDELATVAGRLFMEVYANPPGPFNSFSGFVAQIADMTPEQRARIEVEADTMPREFRTSIENLIAATGARSSTGLIERIGGAWIAQDGNRVRVLIEEAGGDPSRLNAAQGAP